MKHSLRYRIQEWFAGRISWVQYPNQQFIPKGAIAKEKTDWISVLFKWMLFGFAMWWVFAPVLFVLLVLLVIYIGSN
jgi:hypothetical protein